MRFCGKCERDRREGDNCPKGFNVNKSFTSVGKICHQQLGSETLLMDRPRECIESKIKILINGDITEHQLLLQDTVISKK
jgi:hypothetical protein